MRYKGTHPRSFQEKYKELSPDQYRADVEEAIIQRERPRWDAHSIMVK